MTWLGLQFFLTKSGTNPDLLAWMTDVSRRVILKTMDFVQDSARTPAAGNLSSNLPQSHVRYYR